MKIKRFNTLEELEKYVNENDFIVEGQNELFRVGKKNINIQGWK